MARRPIAERFWEKVDAPPTRKADECWEWKAARNAQGYGSFFLERNGPKVVRVNAHRVAYSLAYGKDVAGLVVMHTCDNPPCCNPAHLRAGTVGDNNRDRAAKGRGREANQYGTNNANAKLTEDDVRMIKVMVNSGYSQGRVAGFFGVQQPQISRIVNGKQRVREE